VVPAWVPVDDDGWIRCAWNYDDNVYQSYGQYAKLAYDVKNDTDADGYLAGDSDDED
jgi:hypothetical protein